MAYRKFNVRIGGFVNSCVDVYTKHIFAYNN